LRRHWSRDGVDHLTWLHLLHAGHDDAVAG
jgi:hypothetical protein